MHVLTDQWWQLLITRTDGALRRGPEGWMYTPARLTVYELDAAMRGQISLGTYAVSQEGMSSWLCLDADSADGLSHLWQLAQELDPAYTVVETSRRGGHVWWLCPPTPWWIVQAFGRSLIGNSSQIEVFPKGRGRNGVRLPLTKHPKSGQIYPVVDQTTGEHRSIASLRRLTVAPIPEVPKLHQPAVRPTLAQPSGEAFRELVATVEQLTDVRQYAPERAIGRCPFHDDRRPSLSLLGGFWRCWAGCGEGGLHAFRARAREKGLEVRDNAVFPTQ